MPITIKGPIHIKTGQNIGEAILQKMTESGVKVTLPFSAVGWQSDRIPKPVTIEDITVNRDNGALASTGKPKAKAAEEPTLQLTEKGKAAVEEIKKKQVVGKVEEQHPTREELEAMSFKELKKLANEKYKVTGSSSKGIIKDIFKAIKTGYKEL